MGGEEEAELPVRRPRLGLRACARLTWGRGSGAGMAQGKWQMAKAGISLSKQLHASEVQLLLARRGMVCKLVVKGGGRAAPGF